MPLEIEASWYRGLRSVKWQPEGVAVLVGQNGAGKSTLLNLLFGGVWGVVHVNAPKGKAAVVTIIVDDLRYGAAALSDGSILQFLMGQTLAIRKNFGETRTGGLKNPNTGKPAEVADAKRQSVFGAWLDKDRELQPEGK
ncbi:MAG: ATP-binding cassette domain-containing protein, partial [Polyangiaceae bacterium]|nr:ATP-binding cassette domain-containing protein [Polyangiaceae bacterium]